MAYPDASPDELTPARVVSLVALGVVEMVSLACAPIPVLVSTLAVLGLIATLDPQVCAAWIPSVRVVFSSRTVTTDCTWRTVCACAVHAHPPPPQAPERKMRSKKQAKKERNEKERKAEGTWRLGPHPPPPGVSYAGEGVVLTPWNSTGAPTAVIAPPCPLHSHAPGHDRPPAHTPPTQDAVPGKDAEKVKMKVWVDADKNVIRYRGEKA